jgi:hypothetical protein
MSTVSQSVAAPARATFRAVPTLKRLPIAIAVGLVAAFRTFRIAGMNPVPRDVGQVWFAARALLEGKDPYALIGPGLAFEWPAPLFYPLPAAVALVPLAPFSVQWASTLFMLVGATCLAWALMQNGYGPLFGCCSSCVVFAAELAQWSPLLAAGFVVAPLSLLWVAKPSIGLALSVGRPTRWPGMGVVVLGGVAFLAQPHWFGAWRHALASTSRVRGVGFPYIAPVVMPGGFLALLALLRWRRPEARLVAALACVPQTMLLYEAVPLFLVPRTLRETELLVLLSYVALGFMPHTSAFAPDIDASGRWIVIFLYIPATLMVLRRPNEGSIPAWIESRVERLPRWLRGVPAAAA